MTKYELSLSKDYVPSWTVVDAVRELFQNALDQQVVVEDNDMFFVYDISTGTLKIGNKKSILEAKSLLLGTSTKRDDDRTIGQFGEGYKVAVLVLLRLGKEVTFYNYGAKEVWKPRFVNSRRYGVEVLTFFVDKKFPWQSVPDNNLTIEITNITPEEYNLIVESNLHLQTPATVIETELGRILLDEQHKGRVFVNGLFVCDYQYELGYDFKPGVLKLDRDRKLASSFDLQWLASRTWAKASNHELAAELIQKDAPDVAYVRNVSTYEVKFKPTSDTILTKFREEHGEKAIPVSTQSELEQVPEGYKPVMTNEQHKELITSHPEYKQPEVVRVKSAKERLVEWWDTYQFWVPTEAVDKFNAILEDIN